jgi:chemotaxis response regulator CheB
MLSGVASRAVLATRHSGVAPQFDAVVVVGSQGALRSFQLVLSRLQASCPTPIIFDLHRSEGYAILEQLLVRHSQLDGRPAAEGLALEPSTLYVARHDRNSRSPSSG